MAGYGRSHFHFDVNRYFTGGTIIFTSAWSVSPVTDLDRVDQNPVSDNTQVAKHACAAISSR